MAASWSGVRDVICKASDNSAGLHILIVLVLLMRYLGLVWGPGYPREQVGPGEKEKAAHAAEDRPGCVALRTWCVVVVAA